MVYSDMNTAFSRNLEIQKGACPSGQVPFIIARVMITSQLLPARQPTGTDYQHITANMGNIWETTNFLFRLKEKRMDFNAGGLSLSLDVLIYTIRYSKPKSEE